MKRFYISAILTLICAIALHAQTIFDRYADTDGVTTVYISKTMLSMMPDMKANGVNIGPIASKLDNIRILSCEKKELIQKIKAETQSLGKGYEQLMQVNNNGETVDIYMKSHSGGKKEYLVRVSEKAGLVIILISGAITTSDIKKMVMNNKQNSTQHMTTP